MTYSPDITAKTRTTLAAAIDRNDFAAFNASYIAFLEQFDAFHAARSDQPTGVPVRNALFGQNGFFLKPTSPTTGRNLLTRARAASRAMAALSLPDRLRFVQLLDEHIGRYSDEIALTIAADTGKPIDLCMAEMAKGKEWFVAVLAKLQRRIDKPATNLKDRFRPRGAVQIISAYNYPYALAISGIACSLATGNGVIVSAPLKAPNWIFPFMQAAKEAVAAFLKEVEGRPYYDALAKEVGGIIAYNIGVNQELTRNIDVVHLVGSDRVGTLIRDSRGYKPTILEMGSTNVITVMRSAVADEAAAKAVAQKIYGGFGPATGQRCTAPRILCIQKGAEAVATALKEICRNGPGPGEIGNPFTPGVKIGPLVDRGAFEHMQAAIALAKALGAEIHGTLRVSSATLPIAANETAYWVNPIVIDWSKAQADPMNRSEIDACLKQEIFGPILHILQPVATLGEAIQLVKTLDVGGLASAIFTTDEEDVLAYGSGITVTSLAVNGAPKDQSPKGPHGHPGSVTIGGHNLFWPYEIRGVNAYFA